MTFKQQKETKQSKQNKLNQDLEKELERIEEIDFMQGAEDKMGSSYGLGLEAGKTT